MPRRPDAKMRGAVLRVSLRPTIAALALSALTCAGPVSGLPGPAVATEAPMAQPARELFRQARSWAYQLQKIDLAAIAASQFDVVVIDHAPDRVESVELLFRRADLEPLKRKPDGSRRLVLAYVSIGEAERYRFYWDDAWLDPHNCPAWLGPVNPQWAGNHPVRFWMPDWQGLMFGRSDSYVDRVLEAGFDGIYLDRADVYDEFPARKTGRADMVEFLIHLADHARQVTPGSVVVLQNAEELLHSARLRQRIDGIAKESLYFDPDHGGRAMPRAEQRASIQALDLMQKSGGKVMVVEYLADDAKAAMARAAAEKAGYLVHFAERSLSSLNQQGARHAVEATAAGSARIMATQLLDPSLGRASPCS